MATLTALSNANGATEVTLVNNSTDTGYLLLADAEWGNTVWDMAFSGPRGTQGARPAQGKPQNRPLVLPLRVTGTTKDQLLQRMSVLFELMDEMRRFGGKFTWKSNSQSYRQHFYVLAGGASAREWGNRAESKNRTVMVLEATCEPYLRGDSMKVTDAFSTNSLSDYTYDSGAASNESIANGVLNAAANLTTENRAIHTARGYDYGDNQQTLVFYPGATITSFKAGVVVKRISATTYLEVYVDDNGTNSRLRLDKVVSGVRTNLATSNLVSRVSNGTVGYVRGRIEGDTVYREYFTAVPTPVSTPTLSGSTALGGDAGTFGSAVVGKPGRVWIPQHASAIVDEYRVEPYVYRSQTLPQKLTLYGAIPGDAPALSDLSVTIPTGASDIPWAMFGWAQRTSGSGTVPFGIIEAEGMTVTTWAVTADVDYRGGSGVQATTAGAGSAVATISVRPSRLIPDDYTIGEVAVEVWGRVELASTVVTPNLRLSTYPNTGGSSAQRYTNEWGTSGVNVTAPSSGTNFRFVRLGTLLFPTETLRSATDWTLRLEATWLVGSTGTFGFDYLLLVPAKARTLGATAKTSDTSYPNFYNANGSDLTRTIRSDGSGLVGIEASNTEDVWHGLGGALPELPQGDVDLLVKLSSVIPDRLGSFTTGETLSHSATVAVAPTPRWHHFRGV